ncbi:MAG: nuclear transport factor 2 family protein [Hyphomonadaceae bacterium]|nr:nuclear transport factor 2 family protein [Hyphomonadaceae bacterium]
MADLIGLKSSGAAAPSTARLTEEDMAMDNLDRRSLLLAPAVLTACASQTGAEPQSAESVLISFLRAFEDCDLPRMEAAFAEDATYFDRALATETQDLSSYRRGRGMPAGMRRLAQQLPTTRPGPPYHRLTPEDLLIQEVGDVAVCSFHLPSQSALGRRTIILRRRAGRWKIMHIHASNIEQA